MTETFWSEWTATRWTGGLAVLNQRVARIRPRLERYCPALLEEFLSAYLELIRDNTSSLTVRHMSLSTLKSVPLPAPPRPEQDRIVQTLAAAAKLIEDAGRDLASSANRATMLRNRIERERFLPEDDWDEAPLGELGDLRAGLALGRKSAAGASTSRPYLRTANVQRGRLDLTDVRTMQLQPAEAERFALKAGDILMVEGGDRDKLGRGTVWSDELPGCVHQNHIFRLRLNATDRVTPQFVSRFLNTVGQAAFEANATQTSNLASISRRAVAAIWIPIPPAGVASRLDVEAAAARRASDDAERELSQARVLLASARRALTAAAAAGRLSDPEPGDEFVSWELIPAHGKAQPEDLRKRVKAKQSDKTMAAAKPGARRTLEETLRLASGPMSPEMLFAGAGYFQHEVDDFYRALHAAVIAGTISETDDRKLRMVRQGGDAA